MPLPLKTVSILLLVFAPASSITSAFSEIAKRTSSPVSTLHRPRFRPTCDCQRRPNTDELLHRRFRNDWASRPIWATVVRLIPISSHTYIQHNIRWHALLQRENPDEVVGTASLKLTNHEVFNTQDKYQVFAVLSQRICLEPALAGAEAINLADRSVAQHMRLLTGFYNNHRLFYTHTPSEPILVLGAIRLLYNDPETLGAALKTLNADLCSAGLVDKGHLGELAARILILTARDYAIRHPKHWKSHLKPVRLLDVLNQLFGSTTWADQNQQAFTTAFAHAYVNFTHWIVTRDPLPEFPTRCDKFIDRGVYSVLLKFIRKLLANFWARGAALQCCFNQSSIDFFIVVYFGSVVDGAFFDPDLLSDFVVQVKFKQDADTKAERKMQRGAIPSNGALPYLALLMELDSESVHRETGSKICSAIPDSALTDSRFRSRLSDWMTAVSKLAQEKQRKTASTAHIKGLQRNVDEKRFAMDSCNRYSIAIRGFSAEVYGILGTAQIAPQFATLVRTTMPAYTPPESALQHMRPSERLEETSAYMDWMYDYIVDGST